MTGEPDNLDADLFDAVREAFSTDVAYAILIAKAANTIIARREAQSLKKASLGGPELAL